jgi:hypothetical protein
MIISKYGKSYDTADGSEQHHTAPRQPAIDIQRVAPSGVQAKGTAPDDAPTEKHDNDGGPLLAQPPISPLELSAKPGWSVLSLRALNQAIRLGDWPDNPANLRRAEENAERKKVEAGELEATRTASRARAERNRYRNPWENT